LVTETIHIPLLDEGTDVSRPTQGSAMGDNTYRVIATDSYELDGEHWMFPPGSIVRCKEKPTNAGKILVAYELVGTSGTA
jgi:hypothetical protein